MWRTMQKARNIAVLGGEAARSQILDRHDTGLRAAQCLAKFSRTFLSLSVSTYALTCPRTFGGTEGNRGKQNMCSGLELSR